MQRVRGEGLEQLSFAWAGSLAPGEPHYYRIHGTWFAIEYDCIQNEANHVHTVWRDFDHDFGGEAYRQHLREHH